MVSKFTIYGERCSGTNYLEGLIKQNFQTEVTWEYGWKHFFGHQSLQNSDDTLFVCIVRNPCDWLNSFYQQPHHLPPILKPIQINKSYPISIQAKLHNVSAYRFLNHEFWSIHNNGQEAMEGRHIYTKKRYKNVFDLRHTKLKFLIEDMPKLVKHTVFIKYEDLIHDFKNTMDKIQQAGNLQVKSNIQYPLNITTYKAIKGANVFSNKPKKIRPIPDYKILHHPQLNPTFEKQLGYI